MVTLIIFPLDLDFLRNHGMKLLIFVLGAKLECIGGALVEQGNARTSLIECPDEPDQKGNFIKLYRKIEIINSPAKKLLAVTATGCDQIFVNEDDRKWKMEQRLNRRGNNLVSMVEEGLVITTEDQLLKISRGNTDVGFYPSKDSLHILNK